MRRVAPLLLALALLLGVSGQGALAGRGWCYSDPVVIIDGQLADVFVSSDLRMLLSATGPIKLVIEIPEDSSGQLVLSDLGFGRGYRVSFVQSSDLTRIDGHTQVRIQAFAPAMNSSLPVQVTFAPRSLDAGLAEILFGTGAQGSANSWVTLATS